MNPPILELRGLRKAFGALVVTDGVSLEVRPGEIHAVIGPNGAGKTTLIHQIGGTLRPDAGTIHLLGTDVTASGMTQRARMGLARSFQITEIVPGFTALENVALAVQASRASSFRFFRRAAGEARFNEPALAALAQLGLAHRATLAAGTLSHGEKRQLELAMAVASGPKLLLLDEPLAGAGPEETTRLIGLLRELRGRYGILLVEHDMSAVFAVADRISVLVYGRLVATGTAAEIRAHPEVRAAYLGEDELA